MTPIENYENYVIFENCDLLNVNTGKYLKPSLNSNGYKGINLCKNGIRKNFSLHRLLAQAFIPNPKNKEQIDHINRDRLDNRLENLRWATRLENSQNKGTQINNTSGIKNINYNGKCWRFKKTINKKQFIKYFKKKEDAIQFKNKFYLENNIVE